jgi:hypothetical protein
MDNKRTIYFYTITGLGKEKITILHTAFLEILKKYKMDRLHKVITSLESGSFCFTTFNTDQTSLDMFKTRVSGQPVSKSR